MNFTQFNSHMSTLFVNDNPLKFEDIITPNNSIHFLLFTHHNLHNILTG